MFCMVVSAVIIHSKRRVYRLAHQDCPISPHYAANSMTDAGRRFSTDYCSRLYTIGTVRMTSFCRECSGHSFDVGRRFCRAVGENRSTSCRGCQTRCANGYIFIWNGPGTYCVCLVFNNGRRIFKTRYTFF